MKSLGHRPIEGEINPGNPVTQFARDQWYKIVALLMIEVGKTEFEITPDLLSKIGDNQKAIVMDTRNNKLIVRMVSMEEGHRLAREVGAIDL